MDGHWFYRTIDTGLALKKKAGNTSHELPTHMDPHRLFRASAADNAGMNTFLAVGTIDK